MPIFTAQLALHANAGMKVCTTLAVEAYIARTNGPKYQHNNCVWCSTGPVKGIFKNLDLGDDSLRR